MVKYMHEKMGMKEITEYFIHKLKDDITKLQKQALSANQNGKYSECKEALHKQGQIIEELIKLAETHRKNF